MSIRETLRPLTCPTSRKFAFHSRRDARRFLKSRQGAGGHAFHATAVYRCPHCGLWHVTSHP